MKPHPVLTILAACLLSCSICIAQTPPAGTPMGQAVPTTADKARLTKLEKEFTAAKMALAKNPKDKKSQKKFATIGALYGHESMTSPVLPPRVKYRQALHIYREVLKVDPTNPVAKQDSDMMIKIYKSMGRPVPKD